MYKILLFSWNWQNPLLVNKHNTAYKHINPSDNTAIIPAAGVLWFLYNSPASLSASLEILAHKQCHHHSHNPNLNIRIEVSLKFRQTYFLISVVGIQVFQRCWHQARRNVPIQKREWFACLQVTAGPGLIVTIAFSLLCLWFLGIFLSNPSLDGFEGLTTETAETIWTWWFKQLCHLFILHFQGEQLTPNMKKAWVVRIDRKYWFEVKGGQLESVTRCVIINLWLMICMFDNKLLLM